MVERSGTESAIATIWRDLLGVEPSSTADFFMLGGNSMLLVVMLDLVQQNLGAGVDAGQLLGEVTIQRIAAAVELELSQRVLRDVG
jgi:hypothetical protein